MVTSLRELAALIQDGSVPAWLREKVSAQKNEIVAALEENREYTLTGPHGEQIVIKRTAHASTAAA